MDNNASPIPAPPALLWSRRAWGALLVAACAGPAKDDPPQPQCRPSDEICNGLDDDCDHLVDDGDPDVTGTVVWFHDSDRDGYGTPDRTTVSCFAPRGYVPDGGDCDDGQALVHPGAAEACDHVDNDCDGLVDDDDPDRIGGRLWYRDQDGDEFGTRWSQLLACAPPAAGYALRDGDCDDSNFGIRPGAPESCDGVDEDCDGVIDEAPAEGDLGWFPDWDGDGFGAAAGLFVACASPLGYVDNAADCDDRNAASATDCGALIEADATMYVEIYDGHKEWSDSWLLSADGTFTGRSYNSPGTWTWDPHALTFTATYTIDPPDTGLTFNGQATDLRSFAGTVNWYASYEWWGQLVR